MQVLQLCKKFPYPLKDGESIAVNGLSQSLVTLGCTVDLLTMNTTKHFFPWKDEPLPELAHYRAIRAVLVDNRLRPQAAFFNLFTRESYHVSRFVSADFGTALRQLLRQESYDIIQLESLFLAPYLPLIRELQPGARVVMRAHNVEHEIWARLATQTGPGPKRWYLSLLARRLARFEIEQLRHYDLLVAISARDLAVFRELGHQGPALVAPIGLPLDHYQPDWAAFDHSLTLAFIGSLDWPPNLEGLRWFFAEVWPRVQAEAPTLVFHLAGRNAPDWLRQLELPGVVFHGEVPDSRDFLNRHPVMVTPLLAGSGMRAKIVEAMALGRVVVTTTIGLEGIPATDGREVIVADDPVTLATALVALGQDRRHLRQLGEQARQLVLNHFHGDRIAEQLLHAYQEVVRAGT